MKNAFVASGFRLPLRIMRGHSRAKNGAASLAYVRLACSS
jgi:hypothetical protein